MIVRFEEDEYIAVAIFDAGNRVQTMEAMDEIFSYLDEDMKLLIFTTVLRLTAMRADFFMMPLTGQRLSILNTGNAGIIW